MTIRVQDVVGPSLPSVVDLYKDCVANEEKWTTVDFKALKILLYKTYLRGQPLFVPGPSIRDAIGSSSRERKRDLQIRTRLYEGDKYRSILGLLKDARDRRTKLFLVAWWLGQEDVCDPEEIIGAEELEKRASKKFRCLSAGEFRLADTVRAWLPYFKRLLRDRCNATSSKTLREQGYEESAVTAASRKRSPIAAACEWLAASRPSLNITAPTLANAYSRVYGPKRSRSSVRPS